MKNRQFWWGIPTWAKCPMTYFGMPVEPYYVFDFNAMVMVLTSNVARRSPRKVEYQVKGKNPDSPAVRTYLLMTSTCQRKLLAKENYACCYQCQT